MMHRRRFALLTALSLATLRCSSAEESTTWGAEDSGLRLGLARGRDDDKLLVSLQNTGTVPLTVLAGMHSASGIAWSFEFAALERHGEKFTVYDTSGPYMVPGDDSFTPEFFTLAPSAVKQFVFPMRQLVHFAKGHDVPLKSLLAQGCVLSVSFGVSEEQLNGPDMHWLRPQVRERLWTGKVFGRL